MKNSTQNRTISFVLHRSHNPEPFFLKNFPSRLLRRCLPPFSPPTPAVARLAVAKGDGDYAFERAKSIKVHGVAPKLRTFAPALICFSESGAAEKAYEVEEHVESAGLHLEESELAASLKVSEFTKLASNLLQLESDDESEEAGRREGFDFPLPKIFADDEMEAAVVDGNVRKLEMEALLLDCSKLVGYFILWEFLQLSYTCLHRCSSQLSLPVLYEKYQNPIDDLILQKISLPSNKKKKMQ